MKLLPGTKPHEVITEIDVVEQKTGVVSVGAGYSESDGMVGILELGENNFRGTGDKVNFHWEFGGSSEGKNYQISYTRPWINDNGDSSGYLFLTAGMTMMTMTPMGIPLPAMTAGERDTI